ncbi:MAG TPA: zf-HC2 domain-containing protein [Polyangiaceae bacterium]|nr:zf-HC2 domain-containing protein [Polyangiaceae bacterium]
MDCTEARTHLLARRRGTLSSDLRVPLDAHLADCPACRNEDAADRELSLALEQRLPPHRAPQSLRRALRTQWLAPSPRPRVSSVARMAAAMAIGGAIALLAVTAWRARAPDQAMLAEAVNDHLRVLYSQRPLEVESSDRHQVKPWFEGRLDFAPVTAFDGDDEFPLQGGTIGYFVDRKAATLVFKRRLHVITLFIFPARGLRWPVFGAQPIGGVRGSLETLRGFHVLIWQDGDLGYALVSDVNEADLLKLGTKIAGG